MSSEVIQCPACSHPVRVPESLLGQAVRCPKCKAYFTAPTRDVDGFLGTPELMNEPPVRPSISVGPNAHARGASVMFPGMVLLLVGTCGIIVNATVASVLTYRRAAVIEALKKSIEDPNNNANKMAGRQLTVDDIKEDNLDVLRNISLLFLPISFVACLGAVAMLTLRFYWLAILGSGLAIINFGNCCCLAGLPVGIWCLVKLLDPDVRVLFRR